jgi:hypothetical protein
MRITVTPVEMDAEFVGGAGKGGGVGPVDEGRQALIGFDMLEPIGGARPMTV